MRVLVTGAAGWVGSAVVPLLAKDHVVRTADIVATGSDVVSDEIVGDLADWRVAEEAVQGVDAVVHLATGSVSTDDERPLGAVIDSVAATGGLLEAARAEGCRRFVLMSSCAVVTGHPRGTRIGPATAISYSGHYAMTKHLQEVLGQQYASESDMAIPILRPWSVVDADGRTFRGDRSLPSETDPFAHDGVFGWIDRHDLADACDKAITVDVAGSPVVHLLASPLGREIFDMRAADELLGWTPRHDFAEYIPAGTHVPSAPPDSGIRS